MKIAIASGKGGTGKSTVAANLGFTLSLSREIALVDCDVEEPNLHLFFPAPATDVPVTTRSRRSIPTAAPSAVSAGSSAGSGRSPS